jgi:hypothetical protein
MVDERGSHRGRRGGRGATVDGRGGWGERGFVGEISDPLQSLSSGRLLCSGRSPGPHSTILPILQDLHCIPGIGGALQYSSSTDGDIDRGERPTTSDAVQKNDLQDEPTSSSFAATGINKTRGRPNPGNGIMDSRRGGDSVYGIGCGDNVGQVDESSDIGHGNVGPVQRPHENRFDPSETNRLADVFQLFGISSILSSLPTEIPNQTIDQSELSESGARQSTADVSGLSSKCGGDRTPPQSTDNRPICTKRAPRADSTATANEWGKLHVHSRQEELRRSIQTRLTSVNAPITDEEYQMIESKLLYGPLRLVGHDEDIVRQLLWLEEDSYQDAIDTLARLQLPYHNLLAIFATDVLAVFISRDRSDGLIYGFNKDSWELLICGFTWHSAFEVLDAYILYGETVAFISATPENREKYRNGWRPPPLPCLGVYE